ncbi:MAG TPA: hypothetical protein VGO62_11640, partial [Myxococcota bacterium]
DSVYDGAFAKNGRAWESVELAGAAIYVGGMNSNLSKTFAAMAALQRVTGEEVVAIHNATSGPAFDYLEIAGDLMKVGASKAAQTLAATIVSELLAHDEPIKLAGHSQGTLIISRAIELARDELVKGGMPDVQQMLGRLFVRTFAGTAFDYPDGPRYQHFRNDVDPCPATRRTSSATSAPAILQGLGSLAHGQLPSTPKLGKGAVLVEFHDDAKGTPYSKHRLATYLAHVTPLIG